MAPTAHHSTLRVAVLAGGDSAEREVSLRSGCGVAAALAAAGHYAALVDPADCPLDDVCWSAFDACFVALHGGAGEDGRVQRELERLEVPYTGSGPQACRLAMSKSAAKNQFTLHGVRTPRYALIAEDETPAAAARRVARLGYPLVVKPDAQGSSVGLALADGPDQLAQALTEARKPGGPTLAEPLVRGREFTVALLDDVALPTIEIVTPEAVFSYDAKYHSSLTEYLFDFELADEPRDEIHSAAVGAARALGTSGLARVDLILSHDGAWVLEVNTVPGLTARSLAPLAAARAGIDMPQLCEMLVRRCLAVAGVA
jgi:D-alanine-D-alanine ligase